MARACLSAVLSLSASVPDKQGVRPVDIAACKGNLRLLELLKASGGKPGPGVLVAACAGQSFMGKYLF